IPRSTEKLDRATFSLCCQRQSSIRLAASRPFPVKVEAVEETKIVADDSNASGTRLLLHDDGDVLPVRLGRVPNERLNLLRGAAQAADVEDVMRPVLGLPQQDASGIVRVSGLLLVERGRRQVPGAHAANQRRDAVDDGKPVPAEHHTGLVDEFSLK